MNLVAERQTMRIATVAISLAAGVLLSSLGGFPSLEAQGAGTVYVAPDGNDGWSGTLPAANQERTDGPFKTLGRARDAIRHIKKDAAASPTVLVRGGTYYLPEPLAAPLTIRNEGSSGPLRGLSGERPILSGGRPVSGWQKADGNLWTAQIDPGVAKKWSAQQLFVDGKRGVRRCTPISIPPIPRPADICSCGPRRTGRAGLGLVWVPSTTRAISWSTTRKSRPTGSTRFGSIMARTINPPGPPEPWTITPR